MAEELGRNESKFYELGAIVYLTKVYKFKPANSSLIDRKLSSLGGSSMTPSPGNTPFRKYRVFH